MDKLNFTSTEELKNKFKDFLGKDDVTTDEQVDAMEAYFKGISNKAMDQVKAEYEELKHVTEASVLAARGINTLSPEELVFYNEVKKTGEIPADKLLPETVIERVFEDLQRDRPLLRAIKFTPGVGKQKIITSKRLGKAVWGPLHRDLEGQLDMTFDVRETSLLSLTAFFLISNDTLDLGPAWLDRYIRICLQEAIADAWEEAIVAGTGNNEPIGLMKDLDGAVTGGKYPDKKAKGTLTFADGKAMVKEIGQIRKDLSQYTVKYTDAGGQEKKETRRRSVSGKVKLIVNPLDYYALEIATASQNLNGMFVYNIPFITFEDVIESEYVPEGKVIAFLDGQYEAQTAFTNRIYEYKETFAMKRATLYAMDVFGDGTPSDNDSALVYNLKIASSTSGTGSPA
ncbi:phage major capsid protein [Hutsoniella sourekii]|uniref:phage major capsid protein n=1 Tax=Hutsoniella sourekii TaxID=87650 RepID=UPI000484E3CE|nr:phage major capsid protein [Hutsoniella sourekii]